MISKNDRYGAQMIFLNQVGILHRMGHSVTVVVRGTAGYVTDSVQAIGLECHGIPMNGVGDFLILLKLFKKRRIDVIHTTLDRADYFGLLLSRVCRRPIVSTMMVPRFHPGYRCMDRVITLSNKQAALLRERGTRSERISVLRPGIDIRRFSHPDPVRREVWRMKLGTDNFSTIFCHISSLLERKAHTVSLNLVSACRKRGEKPLLIITGDPIAGPYYDSLIRRSRRLGIAENLFFTGWTPDVPEILSLSHFTVLPSEHEALGVVLLESMAAGTPIIAREGEGGAELIEEYGTGFLYNPKDGVSRLADRLVHLARDRARFAELSKKCRMTADREFSLVGFGQRLADLYAGVVKP